MHIFISLYNFGTYFKKDTLIQNHIIDCRQLNQFMIADCYFSNKT